MKYEIEYEEIIRRMNSVIIKVDNEDEGDEIADELYRRSHEFDNPDCIFDVINDLGVEVIETCEGDEECKYEIQ